MLDVLIITHNRLEYLKKSLPSILDQSYAHIRYTIWDNDSRDDVKEFLKTIKNPNVKIYFNWDNESLASVTTRFARKASGTYLGKVDSDMIIPRDWAERLIQKHQEGHYGFLGGFHLFHEDLKGIEPIIKNDVWEKKHIGGQFIIRREDFKGYGGEGVMGLSEYQESVGLPNGYLWNPILWVEHMEDSRSKHHISNGEYDDYKIKTRGITLEKYQTGIVNHNYLNENSILRKA